MGPAFAANFTKTGGYINLEESSIADSGAFTVTVDPNSDDFNSTSAASALSIEQYSIEDQTGHSLVATPGIATNSVSHTVTPVALDSTDLADGELRLSVTMKDAAGNTATVVDADRIILGEALMLCGAGLTGVGADTQSPVVTANFSDTDRYFNLQESLSGGPNFTVTVVGNDRNDGILSSPVSYFSYVRDQALNTLLSSGMLFTTPAGVDTLFVIQALVTSAAPALVDGPLRLSLNLTDEAGNAANYLTQLDTMTLGKTPTYLESLAAPRP